ncbi:GIY-YIG nuclease family protein [Novosphingobium olei]|uniref:GIY-YIG nuclease family protein n=1 Tax=Novosphingobium olei TaxID=2728851 RepID=UPI00308DA25D|nr:hypothetical protein NSDW_09400 [Novosphingobium olei]
MEKVGWVTIMANSFCGGMYVGVISDLIRRVRQHREGQGSIHARDFGKTSPVYADRHEEIELATAREKLVKKWRREWKFALIEADNRDWLDNWDQWYPAAVAQSASTKQPSPVSITGRRGIWVGICPSTKGNGNHRHRIPRAIGPLWLSIALTRLFGSSGCRAGCQQTDIRYLFGATL